VPALLAADAFPWGAAGSWAPLLRPDVAARIRLPEYVADRYSQARAEVPLLPGENQRDRRIREVLYLGLTRWLPGMLDRKDRLSMASGLEVRVPFCDHRLVDYVWNVPWPMKETGDIEKGLLRAAAADLLPSGLVNRAKSVYPGVANPAYQAAIDVQMRDLLASPGAPVFSLVSHASLAAAYAADPSLPGYQGIQPSSTSPASFLLDVNEWLRRYHVRIV
jgi:asparagine synthase (glutamine-hydrolysing)